MSRVYEQFEKHVPGEVKYDPERIDCVAILRTVVAGPLYYLFVRWFVLFENDLRYVEELTHKHRDYQSATMPSPTCRRTSPHIPQTPDQA